MLPSHTGNPRFAIQLAKVALIHERLGCYAHSSTLLIDYRFANYTTTCFPAIIWSRTLDGLVHCVDELPGSNTFFT